MNRITLALVTLVALCVFGSMDYEDEITAAAYKCDVLGGVWDDKNLNCEGEIT